MPYISQDKRDVLDDAIDELHHKLVELQMDDEQNNMEGNLNYVYSRLLLMVYGEAHCTSYSSINDAVGVLENVKLNYTRTVINPYEQQKEFDNGEIEVFRHPPEVVEAITVTPEDVKAYNEVVEKHGSFADLITRAQHEDD